MQSCFRATIKEAVAQFVFFMDLLYKGPDFEAKTIAIFVSVSRSYLDFSMFSAVGYNGDSKLRRK